MTKSCPPDLAAFKHEPADYEAVTVAICSARPRALLHSGRKGGNQWWARDVYHLRDEFNPSRSRCGRDASEWLVIGPIEEVDDNCCKRCLASTVEGRKARAALSLARGETLNG